LVLIRSLRITQTVEGNMANDSNGNNTFIDSKTLLAIVLVGLVWFGWQSYLSKKYPQVKNPTSQGEKVATPSDPALATTAEAPTETSPAGKPTSVAAKASASEQLIAYENNDISFHISSYGMGLKDLTLKNHTDRKNQPIQIGQSDLYSLFQLRNLQTNEIVLFSVTQKSANVFEGTALLQGAKLTRTMEIMPDTEAIRTKVVIEGVTAGFPGISINIPEKTVEYGSGSFLIPTLEHQELVAIHSGTTDRLNSSSAKEKVDQTYSAVSLAGIGNQYFASAIIDKSEIIPDVKLTGGKTEAEMLVQMQYRPTAGKDTVELNWISYAGPKSLSNLEKIDKEMAKVVNLGFFASIGRILLMFLKWFHSVFGNWGVAIILLTLMVRTLVLPLNISTFKSTKKMQKLQPLLSSLKVRYKDDPQALNRETMALWKEHKVNPVGGCLPMLLQLPIFFALYQVLGQSIELYQAPFIFWIKDLSLKDPFYVLPVLMGVAMYFQQKMTPTQMDPTQAKIMQFMPVIFSLMMVSLPAGLTLYIFINTLSGVLLQQAFVRDRKVATDTKPVKA
jgi:YidC/Oxa1 family membrane protein insertase